MGRHGRRTQGAFFGVGSWCSFERGDVSPCLGADLLPTVAELAGGWVMRLTAWTGSLPMC